MRSATLAVLLLSPTASAVAQLPSDPPVLSGYVTAIPGPGQFDVDGIHIRLDPATRLDQQDGKVLTIVHQLAPVYVGEPFQIWGVSNKKSHTLRASAIRQTLAAPATVSGAAMIDFVPPQSGSGDRLVRADGYLLRFNKDSHVNFNPPLTATDQLTTNVWVEYKGVQQVDGVVFVNAAEVWPNHIPKSEDKLRTKREFDPSSVDGGDAQSGLSKAFLGVDDRRLPAHQDAVLQARVERIGQSLVPAYQKALVTSDPSRIHFRFQVVEAKYFRDAIAFANGIILVPYPAITRLQNDSQIAAVLADNIAASLEKQEILLQPTVHTMTAANIAGLAGGFFIPGLGLATQATTYGVAKHLITQQQRQSGRVALCLMHDAGYDLTQAPIAWWLLAPAKAKPVEEIKLPGRAAYAYSVLGTTWASIQQRPAN